MVRSGAYCGASLYGYVCRVGKGIPDLAMGLALWPLFLLHELGVHAVWWSIITALRAICASCTENGAGVPRSVQVHMSGEAHKRSTNQVQKCL